MEHLQQLGNNDISKNLCIIFINHYDVYALLADESSDNGHWEQFAGLIRFPNQDNSTVNELYLGPFTLQRTDAARLVQAIEQFLLARGLDIPKVLFVVFDGCNTLSGEKAGEGKIYI